MNHVIHGRLSPFTDYEPPICYQVEAGKTISEIVRAAPNVPDWFWYVDAGGPAGGVKINGKWVSRDAWDIMTPKLSRPDRPIVITLHPVYHGGGGGGGSTKNIITTVAAIALIAGATLVSGGLLGPVAAGTIGTGVFGTAFGVGADGCQLCPCTPQIWNVIKPKGV